MADTFKRLAGPVQLSTGAVTRYTVPSSTTTAIRNILVCNTTGNQAKLTMSVGADADATRIFKDHVIEPRSTFEFHGLIVMTATEILQAFSDTASALTLTVSGVETT